VNTFTALCKVCGLSVGEAAAFLGASENTVLSWRRGRRGYPPGVIAELRTLYRSLDHAAGQTIARVLAMPDPPDEIRLGIAADDHEARSLGLPCVGAHEALLGMIAARLDRRVVIVPRGSDPATAAAIDARER
jgi:hypothetical protein